MEAQQVFKRFEKKYLMTTEQEEQFLKAIEGYMLLDKYGEHTICNIYYDTADFDLIRRSIEKPVYKEKLRVRSYGVPSDDECRVFVELKKKYEGIVYKRRVPMTLAESEAYLRSGLRPVFDPEKMDEGTIKNNEQILNEIDWFMKMNKIQPGLYLAYDRRAFAGIEDPGFRLTLDRNIRCRRRNMKLEDGAYGEQLLPEGQVLMEIKISGAMPLWMSKILADLQIMPVSISKYGTYYMTHKELFMQPLSNRGIDLNSGRLLNIADARAARQSRKDAEAR